MRYLLAGVMLLSVMGPLQAAEKVYRWVDAEGGVHYSATPPPGQAVPEEELRYQRNPDPKAAENTLKGYQDGTEKRRTEEQQAATKAAEQQKLAAERRRNCDTARGIVSRLQATPNMRYKQDDGSYRNYSTEEIDRKISEARASEREFCD